MMVWNDNPFFRLSPAPLLLFSFTMEVILDMLNVFNLQQLAP